MQAHKLTMRRTFQEPAAAIFAAFLSVEAIKEWWAPEGFEVVDAQVDAHVGGRYSVAFRSRTNASVVLYQCGVYHEITPPTRLVFTHVFEERSTSPPLAAVGMFGQESLVTVELHAHGDVTEVVLVHEQLPTAAAGEMVREGWQSAMENMAHYLERVRADETPSA